MDGQAEASAVKQAAIRHNACIGMETLFTRRVANMHVNGQWNAASYDIEGRWTTLWRPALDRLNGGRLRWFATQRERVEERLASFGISLLRRGLDHRLLRLRDQIGRLAFDQR